MNDRDEGCGTGIQVTGGVRSRWEDPATEMGRGEEVQGEFVREFGREFGEGRGWRRVGKIQWEGRERDRRREGMTEATG